METEFRQQYGQKVRLRTCGLCWLDGKLLMINHQGLYPHDFWSPPGGGVDFGQSASHTIVREFQEETSLDVTCGKYLFCCELIKPPLHAIELFFEVHYESGALKIGTDPETKNQIIKEVRWMSPEEVMALPVTHRHGIFNQCERPEQVMNMHGFWPI